MPDPLRFLGFDPGTKVAGYGVVDLILPNRLAYVECGELRLSGTLEERLAQLRVDADEVVSEFRPTAAGLECAYVGKNPQSALRLAEARGVLMGVLAAHGVETHQFQPSTAKKAAAGNGRASKKHVQTALMVMLGLKSTPGLDASDALAHAVCCALKHKAAR